MLMKIIKCKLLNDFSIALKMYLNICQDFIFLHSLVTQQNKVYKVGLLAD